MPSRFDPELLAKMTVEVAVAYLNRNGIDRSELPALIGEIRDALDPSVGGVSRPAAPLLRVVTAEPDSQASENERLDEAAKKANTPAVSVSDSVTDQYLVSLEDGKHYRSLRRHLMAKYGMTPDDYRRKWNLPPDYPMVAPSYARERSSVAKRTGLGQAPKVNSLNANRPPAHRR